MTRMVRAITAIEPPFFESDIPIPFAPPDIALLTAIERADDIIDLALAVSEKRIAPHEAVKALGASGNAPGKGE